MNELYGTPTDGATLFNYTGAWSKPVYTITATGNATDAGLTGYGDTRVRPNAIPAKDSLDHLVGRSPFDFVNDNRGEGGSGLLCALYDLMGKHLDLLVLVGLLGVTARFSWLVFHFRWIDEAGAE